MLVKDHYEKKGLSLKLFHFTSRHHIQGCLKEGLTKGVIPLSVDPPILVKDFQWLTTNKTFDQSWCRYGTLPYNRNDYRITVKIPKNKRNLLIRWMLLCKHEKFKLSAMALNSQGDPNNWYLFKGIVKPKWFRDVIENPYKEV